MKETLKNLLAPGVFLLVIALAALGLSLVKPVEKEDEIIPINQYDGPEGTIVLENEYLKLEMDSSTTHFTVTEKANGKVWYSNPQDADSDPIALPVNIDNLKATMMVTYSTQSGVDTPLDNYRYSIYNGNYNIEATDEYIKVFYSIGQVEKEYIIPQVISLDRMNELLDQMEKADAQLVKDYYKKYDINKLGKKDNKEELLQKYPILADQVMYILRDGVKKNIRTKLEPVFEAAGYTAEEYAQEMEEYGIESSSKKPVYNVNMVYRLDGSDLVVDVPLEEVEYKKDYPLIYVNILPFFGAAGTSETGYMLVPEGGGSIIDFNNGKVAQNSYTSNLYGWDMAQSRDSVVHETRIYYNAFGIAREDASVLCILESGSPYARIDADISGRINSYNYVSATYTVMHRDKVNVAERMNGDMFVYEQQLPEEHLTQRYSFVASGDYVEMANAYHEYLSDRFGNSFDKNDDASVPVAVEVVGAVDKVKQILGVPVSRPLKVTTYKEAQGILASLHDGGVKNLSVKLSGWMNGGVNQSILKKVKLVSSLGSKKDFTSLMQYAADNRIPIYLDGVTNYAYDSNVFDGFFIFRDAATLTNKKRVKITPFDPIYYGESEYLDSYYLLKPSLTLTLTDNLCGAAEKYGAAGVSFADIGYQLSADYSRKHLVTRQAAAVQQEEKLGQIKDSGLGVMVNMGNDYTLGTADFIVNMDLNGSGYTIIDRTVPFYQIAVHGFVNYSGEPINLTESYEEELLKSVECGAGLYFTFMEAPITELQNTYFTQYFGANYDSWKDRFFTIYERYEAALGHTYNQRITGHRYLDDDVTVTEYEDGTKAYVNYRYEDYTTADGLVLPARDYVVQ